MDTSAGTIPTPTATRIHLRALVLAATLFALFVAAAGLYARFGYAVVLRVYEEQQVANAALRVGSGKIVELGDYLRVDPANLRVRGLLVNQWIEFKDPPRALEAARAGIAVVTPDQRPIVMLLVARAQIAGGALDDATGTYRDVLASGVSREAHHKLARIAAARGDFKTMRDEYEKCERSWGFVTPDYNDRYDHALSFVDCGDFDAYADTDAAFRISAALNSERLAHIDNTFASIAEPVDFSGAPPAALFWRAVYEEEKGHRDVALDFYQRAADAGDALGAFAYRRLSQPTAQ